VGWLNDGAVSDILHHNFSIMLDFGDKYLSTHSNSKTAPSIDQPTVLWVRKLTKDAFLNL
jgi:hypothetical protein